MDRLIALVALRFRLDLRAILGARERLVGLVLLLPTLALGSAAASFFVFVGARALARSHPEWLLPVISAVATIVGLFWALSPLLAGVSFSDTHDMSRLLHFPVPLPTLVVSSLLANLLEPLVLAKLPPLLALSFALAGLSPRLPLSLLRRAPRLRLHPGGRPGGRPLPARPRPQPALAGPRALPGARRGLRHQRPSPRPHERGRPGPATARCSSSWSTTSSWPRRSAGVCAPPPTRAGASFVPFLVFASASVGATLLLTGAAALLTRRVYRGELDLSGSGAGGSPGGRAHGPPRPPGRAPREGPARSCGATRA